MKTKIKKIFTKKNFVCVALLFIIIIYIIAFSFFINKNKVIIKKHDMYYYTLGIKFELKGKIVIDKDSDNITQLTLDDDNSVFIDSTPLYYNDELTRCYENIQSLFLGEKELEELNELEQSYAKQCLAYVDDETDKTLEQWAAYVSRIEACSLISDDKVKIVKSLFFSSTTTMTTSWWRLKEYESETYLKIITGKVDIDYFDEFVKKWYQQGGETITDEVRRELKK